MNLASINENIKIVENPNTLMIPTTYELLSDTRNNVYETKFTLPSDIPVMDEKDIANWKTYKIDSHKDVAEEWASLRCIVANKMVMELMNYSGREQQRKGTVIANVQNFVFGETLPRGHGHRGRLSAYMSGLFDELTGRTPRKRRTITRTYEEPVKIHRTLVPHSLFIGVIGDHNLAKVITQRLLFCNYHVKISNQLFRDQIISEHTVNSLKNTPLNLELANSLEELIQSSEVIIVAHETAGIAESFYFQHDDLWTYLNKKIVYDMTLEDYQISSHIHQEALKRGVRFYDCPLFPIPNTLLSYDLSPPSLFLGGESLPEEFAMNILYSLAVAIYPSRPNYGIVNKCLVSHYYTLQTQVMHEMDIVSQSLGISDDTTFSQMLYSCCNPQSIMTRNKQYASKMIKEKQAQKLSIDTLISPIKQLYSIPLPQLPFTTMICEMADKAIAMSQGGDVDISYLWKLNNTDMQTMQTMQTDSIHME